jgi:predicted porin
MKSYFISIFLIIPFIAFSQDEKISTEQSKYSFSYNVDFVSRYVWRGLMLSQGPNIQPYATYSIGNFSIGTWASYGLSEKYAEVDFNVNYSLGNLLFSVNDYYNEDENDLQSSNFFEYDSKKSTHALEASLAYTISENIPLTLSAATFFYGNDRDSTGDNYYSTYLELNYEFKFSDHTFSIFLGGAANEGYYADKPSIVNVGLSFEKQIPITDKFSLPVSGSLVANPKAKDIFLIFKLTL